MTVDTDDSERRCLSSWRRTNRKITGLNKKIYDFLASYETIDISDLEDISWKSMVLFKCRNLWRKLSLNWLWCCVFLYHCLQNVNPWIIQDMWSGQFLLIWILINFINWTSKWKRWTWKVLIWSKWYQNQTLSQNNKTFSHLMWV